MCVCDSEGEKCAAQVTDTQTVLHPLLEEGASLFHSFFLLQLNQDATSPHKDHHTLHNLVRGFRVKPRLQMLKMKPKPKYDRIRKHERNY